MNSNEGIDHWSDSRQFFYDGCPFCKSIDFLKGPRGGLSINFKCANKDCGATFNAMGPFGIDLLSEPETNKLLNADTVMETKDFVKGEKVKYIPNHAEGNPKHPDCQNGVVSSINDTFVFVKYDNLMGIMITGDEPYTAQATKPEDLILI